MNTHPERPPFQGHKRYYLILKLVVIALAAYLAVRYLTPLTGG